MTALTRDPIDPAAVIESARSPHAGAVVLFLGTVRDRTGGVVTESLDYTAYEPMAELQLQALEADIRGRWPVQECALVHRLGRLAVGEVSVAVAVSCPHRAEAFDAARYAIDTLKQIVPVRKADESAEC